jgi:hypothetical protein
MGVHDELCVTRRCTMKILRLQFYIVLLFYLLSSSYFIGCATSAPDGSSPEATAECLHLVVGSTFATLINSIFFLSHHHLIRSIDNTSDKSSPRAYEQMLAFDHRLSKFFFLTMHFFRTRSFLSAIFCYTTRSFLE